MMLSGRHIISIAAVPASDSGVCAAVYALCVDGTLWILPRTRYRSEWRMVTPIPQDGEAELESLPDGRATGG